MANLNEGPEPMDFLSWRKEFDVGQVRLNAQRELHRFEQFERFGFDHTVSGEYQPPALNCLFQQTWGTKLISRLLE